MGAPAALSLTMRPPPGLPHPAEMLGPPRERQGPPGSFYVHPSRPTAQPLPGRALLGPPPGLVAPRCWTPEGPWAPAAWEGAPSTRCPSQESTRASTKESSRESPPFPCAKVSSADSGSDSDSPGMRPPLGAWNSQSINALNLAERRPCPQSIEHLTSPAPQSINALNLEPSILRDAVCPPPPPPPPDCCRGPRDCRHEQLGKPGVPSAGSAQHHLGLCKPCDFVYRGSCREGTSCKFCHLCGPDETQRRKKEKKRLFRAMRQRQHELPAPVGALLAGPAPTLALAAR